MLVGVIGAGTMGSGIAEVAAKAAQVILVDIDQARAEQGLRAVEKRLNRQVEKGTLESAQRDELLGRITLSTSLQDLHSCSLVVEAAAENLEVKQEIFRFLGEICVPECILATNTSALSVTALAAVTAEPQRVLGMHFFNPVPRMQLVELIRTPFTGSEYLERSKNFVEQLGKTPVVVEEAPGFIVNRLLIPMINEAVYLLGEGIATAEDIDTAMRLGANHPMGPLALADLVGLDICLAIMETLHRELGEDKYRPAPLLRKMVRAGKLGRKTKEGFYNYN